MKHVGAAVRRVGAVGKHELGHLARVGAADGGERLLVAELVQRERADHREHGQVEGDHHEDDALGRVEAGELLRVVEVPGHPPSARRVTHISGSTPVLPILSPTIAALDTCVHSTAGLVS